MNYKKLLARRNDLRKQFLILLGFIILQAALLPLSAAAGTNSYLLESPTPAQAQAACLRYGFGRGFTRPAETMGEGRSERQEP